VLDEGRSRRAQKGQLRRVDVDRLRPALAVLEVVARLLLGPDQVDRRLEQPLGWNNVAGQTHRQGGPAIDGLAAGDHLHGVCQAGDSRGPHRSAPAGIEPQLDLRKADFGLGIV
jgi:hypothetical protein